MKKLLLIFGTRPEAIKLIPLIRILRTNYPELDVKVCTTGQHGLLLTQVLDTFELVPDYTFSLMRGGQNLTDLTSAILKNVSDLLKDIRPDMVVVQGDTTTSMASALASFYCGIPVAHVEAGLRTNNPFSPWPEEINRQIVARIASLHFAPTIQAGKNLEKENIPKASVHVTGNTVVDAMNIARELIDMRAVEIDEKLNKIIPGIQNKKIVLITGHRRESFGSDIESICYALSILANDFRNIHFIYPVHLNPNVIEPVHRILGKSSLKNIHLIEPLDYLLFIALMNRSEIILTDSGGIQEEAPGLGKPVMVTRNTTERTEGIQEAMAMLVGTGKEKIIKEMSAFLLGVNEFFKDAVKSNPYGDGNASLKIAEILNRYLR